MLKRRITKLTVAMIMSIGTAAGLGVLATGTGLAASQAPTHARRDAARGAGDRAALW